MKALLVLYLSLLSQAYCEDVVLNTHYGNIVGFQKDFPDFSMNVFLGVPFAKPLTIDDRGKKSVEPVSWIEDLPTKTYKPACIQDTTKLKNLPISEDCLYLNVFTPTECDTKHPILIFIHGGGFVEGDAIEPDDYPLAKNFVSRGVVVVTIQYRLGVLGFAAINGTTNLGIWDQIMALKFVKKNANKLCGDHNRITVMGHSAGAFSVSALNLSPFTVGLYNRTIQLSGSAWGLTSYRNQAIQSTENFFKALNCTTTYHKCLQTASIKDILYYQSKGTFFPYIGDSILPYEPQNLNSTNTPSLPVLISVMSAESLYFTYLKSNSSIYQTVNEETVINRINDVIIPRFPSDQSSGVFNDSKRFFLPSGRTDYPYYMNQDTQILSTITFNTAIVREAKARSKNGNVYVLSFDYFNPHQFNDDFPMKKTYHCHEFPYIFGRYLVNVFEFDEEDYTIREMLLESYANFIKTGIPQSDSIPWISFDEKFSHVKLAPKPAVHTDLLRDEFNFWEHMKKYGVDGITLDKINNGVNHVKYLLPIILAYLLGSF